MKKILVLLVLLVVVSPLFALDYYDIKNYVLDMIVDEHLEVDEDIAMAILMVENSNLEAEAINVNKNGTSDLGLWQINSAYYDYFCELYDVQKEPVLSWENSTKIAVRHLDALYARLQNWDLVILAYNCGIGAVKSDNIPDSAFFYLDRVKEEYNLSLQVVPNGIELSNRSY